MNGKIKHQTKVFSAQQMCDKYLIAGVTNKHVKKYIYNNNNNINNNYFCFLRYIK